MLQSPSVLSSLLVVALTAISLSYPQAMPVRGQHEDRRRMRRSLAAVAVFGAFGTSILFAFPETILHLAFGAEYVFAGPWLGPLGIAMTLFALGNVYISHFLSLGQTQFALPLAGLLAFEIALFAFFHSAPGDLIGVLIATAGLLVLGSELFGRSLRGSGQLVHDSLGTEPFVPLRALERIHLLQDSDEEVTVVIPAFNEAPTIESTLRDTVACMEEFGCPYEVLLVDDGSRDSTRELSRAVAHEIDEVRVVGYENNMGKGHAIVEGARAAHHGLVLFVDADLEVHPRQLQALYGVMQETIADVVIGSKVHSDSTVDYSRERRLMSWSYYAIVRFFFGLPVRDTQTGLKLFRKDVLDTVAPRMLVKRFAFDLEALVISHRLGFRVVEAPVVVTRERDQQKIGWADALHTAWDTAAVWYRAYLRHYYDSSS